MKISPVLTNTNNANRNVNEGRRHSRKDRRMNLLNKRRHPDCVANIASARKQERRESRSKEFLLCEPPDVHTVVVAF